MKTLKNIKKLIENHWVNIFFTLTLIEAVVLLLLVYALYSAKTEVSYLEWSKEAAWNSRDRISEKLRNALDSNENLLELIDDKDESILRLWELIGDKDESISELNNEKNALNIENEALEKNNKVLRKRVDSYNDAFWSLRDDYDAILINSVSFTVEGSVTVKDIHTAEIKDMSIVHSLNAVPEVCHSTPAFALLSSETEIKEIDLTIASPEGGTVFVDDGEPVIRNTGTHTIKIYKDDNVYTSYILVGWDAKEVDNSIRLLLP